MKITERTPSKLVITHNSIGGAIIAALFGLAFAGAGAYVISQSKLAVLKCNRSASDSPTCILEEKPLIGSRRELQIGTLLGARLKEDLVRDSEEGDSEEGSTYYTYAVLIQSSSGTYQLNRATRDYFFPTDIVNRINQFLANSAEPSLIVQQSSYTDAFFGILFILGGILVGLWLFSTSKSMVFEFDKTFGTLRVKSTFPLNKVTLYQLSNIQKVLVERNLNRPFSSFKFSLSLLLSDGSKVELLSHTVEYEEEHIAEEEFQSIANTIQSFLGLRS